jgi:hypothetical protein
MPSRTARSCRSRAIRRREGIFDRPLPAFIRPQLANSSPNRPKASAGRTSWPDVRSGTVNAIRDTGFDINFAIEIRTTQNGQHAEVHGADWHTKVIAYRNYRGSSGGIHNVRFLRANGVQEAC